MAEIPDHLLERLIATQENTATALAQLAELMRQQDIRRNEAVASVKAHVDARSERSERWWRNVVIALGLMMVLANLVGVAVEKVLAIVK